MYLIFEHLLTVAGFLLAVALLLQILREHRRPGGAMAWVLAIVLIPYLGVPLYLLLGGRKFSRVLQRKTGLYASGSHAAALREPQSDVERVLQTAGMPPATGGNDVQLHFSGESAFAELMRMLESARHSIHAMTFILGRDEVGRSMVEILARKAAEGVEVRFLLDGLGCIWSGGRYVQPVRDAGGQVERFLPVLPLRRKWSANLRNHRKIVVVDGAEAMVGGMNLATSFMGPRSNPKRFLDAAVFVRGPAVADIDEIFVRDWHYTSEEEMPPTAPHPADPPGNADIQVVASGPDVPDDTLHDALLTATMEARERIWVVTPYFVPDDDILKALALQARLGRDVRVLVPERSNHRIPDLARGPALRRLIQAGARVYLYHRGMVHAKVLLFDRSIAVTGSPNLDMRSMYLNFEIALFHYSPNEIDATSAWVERLMGESTLMDQRPIPLVREWGEGLAVLVAPLL